MNCPYIKSYLIFMKRPAFFRTGLSERKLEAEWERITKEACERGTATHNGLEDGIKGSSMFKDAIQYLNQVKSGRCITVADIPNLRARPAAG